MNNAKMWLVVPPAVGVPIFLGAVAVGSFAVHVAVLSNTSWVSDFLSGNPLGSGDAEEAALKLEGMDAQTAKATYVMPSTDGAQQVLVIMPDGTTTMAMLQSPGVIATSASPPRVADQ